MKFLGINGRVGRGSYISFKFESHNPDFVNVGDVIWSNGSNIEISEDVDKADLRNMISEVSNRGSFKGALIRMGFMD